MCFLYISFGGYILFNIINRAGIMSDNMNRRLREDEIQDLQDLQGGLHDRLQDNLTERKEINKELKRVKAIKVENSASERRLKAMKHQNLALEREMVRDIKRMDYSIATGREGGVKTNRG